MIDQPKIVAIVEGDGDERAVPKLIRRVLWEHLHRYDIVVSKAKNARGKPGLLKRVDQFLQYALLDQCDAILVIIDADNECPHRRASSIADQATALKLGVPVAVVCAKAEYETWFICNLTESAGQDIRKYLEIPQFVIAPSAVEEIRGAKEWLSERMPRNRAYQETSDQEPLTYHIDLELTLNGSRSFRRLCHAIEELVHAIDASTTVVTPNSQ